MRETYAINKNQDGVVVQLVESRGVRGVADPSIGILSTNEKFLFPLHSLSNQGQTNSKFLQFTYLFK